jgi:hypothetical protein
MSTTKIKIIEVFWSLLMGLITVFAACHPEKYPILLVAFFGAVFVLQVSKTVVRFIS